jgi:hypothetical protein
MINTAGSNNSMIRMRVSTLPVERQLDAVSRQTKRSVESLIRTFILYAGQSAVKLTPPGKAGKIKSIQRKYKVRPIVNMYNATGRYWYVKADGTMFSLSVKVSTARLNRRGMKRVTKAIKAWDIKANKWYYIPFVGQDKNHKQRTIPAYGAAKAGWIHAVNKAVGKNLGTTSHVRGGLGSGRTSATSGELVNKVRYVAKIASFVPEAAKKSALARLTGSAWPTQKRKIEGKK